MWSRGGGVPCVGAGLGDVSHGPLCAARRDARGEQIREHEACAGACISNGPLDVSLPPFTPLLLPDP